jgi:hypothetical protein
MFPASTKASSGITIAFPDVCKVPVPPGGVTPIPYPSIAKTATAATKTKTPNKTAAMKPSAFSRIQGNMAGIQQGMVSSKNTEVAQLKAMLNQLNTKLQGLKSNDPNEWQGVVQEYVVAASALYVTVHVSS